MAERWHSCRLRLFPALLLTLVLGLMLAFAPARAEEGDGPPAVDYAAWESTANRAEEELGRRSITDQRLNELRAQMAHWRAAFSTAQSANSARIATVKEQIAALGPPPEEGSSEAPEIAQRRTELADQLIRLQAPGIAAEEAYRRADGLIREIDRVVRERQADRLLQLWPSPVNPANWPEAAIGISDTLLRLWDEVTTGWKNRAARDVFFNNLPLILLLLAVALATTIFARRWIEALADRLQARDSGARQRLYGLAASLGQVVLPVAGTLALSTALRLTALPGDLTRPLVAELPLAGLTIFGALWLGGRAFPRERGENPLLPIAPEGCAQGRFLAFMMGLVLVAEELRAVAMDPQGYSDTVTAVASLPILLTGGVLLWRMGRLLALAHEAEAKTYAHTILSLVARALKILGIAGPLLAAAGYVAAAKAAIFPAILSLGLLVLVLELQRLFIDLWSIIAPSEDGGGALLPVLLGFVLVVVSLPVFALIWGVRFADLTELWTRFGEGFQMGETRISPGDFLMFALIFALGYMITRLFQGALRNSILPRTRMDQGGQTALIAGTGYVGVILAALAAINATGIDLSSLAIVAGALSVGIGFGLQNIVQNFVSGVILLLERPVSEGDWIEVGGIQGIVRSISVRSTRIQTFDRTMVIVPNGDLVSQQVKNWTRFGLAGRLVLPVNVAHGTDTRRVARILQEIAEAQPLAILNPPPQVYFQGFTPDGLRFEIFTVLRDVNFSSQVKSEMNHMIAERFAAEGIEIPLTQSEVTLRNAAEVARLLAIQPGSADNTSVAPGQEDAAPLQPDASEGQE